MASQEVGLPRAVHVEIWRVMGTVFSRLTIMMVPLIIQENNGDEIFWDLQ